MTQAVFMNMVNKSTLSRFANAARVTPLTASSTRKVCGASATTACGGSSRLLTLSLASLSCGVYGVELDGRTVQINNCEAHRPGVRNKELGGLG